MEHRTPKSRYLRTSRKGFLKQLTQIERRQARIRRIRKNLGKDEEARTSQDVAISLEARYQIGKTQNQPVDLMSFIYKNAADPAVKVIHFSRAWI